MTALQAPIAPATAALAALDRLTPQIEQTRAVAAARRQLPDDLVRTVAGAGLFRLLVPRTLGGLELDPLAAADVVEAASRIDASVGWAVMIGSQSGWYASFLPRPVAERVLVPPAATLAGALRPGGRAVAVEGGYRVTGRWGLASGCTYADHLYATCVVERRAGEGDTAARSTRELRLVYVPVAAATILDTWHSTGLRATGSHDITLHDVVVPADWTLPMPALGPPPEEGPLYRDRYQNLAFVLQGAQALGVARGAVASFTDLATTTARWLGGAPLRDQPAVRILVAQVEARLAAARAWLRECVGETWDTVTAGDPPTPQQRVHVRLAITHAITTAAQAADDLQRAAGAAAVFADHPLHQRFQDLRTASAHVQASPTVLESTGALLLGADVPPSPLL